MLQILNKILLEGRAVIRLTIPEVSALQIKTLSSNTIKIQLLWGGMKGYVPRGTPNRHPVLKKISPKIDTPF